MNIGIIGCGWLGIRIAKQLNVTNKLKIYATTRSKSKFPELINLKLTPILVNFPYFSPNKSLSPITFDIIIITVSFSRKDSINATQEKLINLISFICFHSFKGQIFIMSSTGIYPDIDSEITENSIPEDVLNPTLLFIEKFMSQEFPQINILRLGGLMGDNRVFSNFKFISPPLTKVVNHIHYYDICCVIEKMIEQKTTSQTFNVVAPIHPTKNEIIEYQKNKTLIKDSLVDTPGKIVLSKKLEQELNYSFKYPNPIFF